MNHKGQLVTSAEAQPFRRQHRAPCSDCPWARKALPGWLGPNTTQEWLMAAHHHASIIACHTRAMPEGMPDPMDLQSASINAILGGHWQCAGAAIYRTNVVKRVEPPVLWLPQNKILVFASPLEFRSHHEGRKGLTNGMGDDHNRRVT